ncbi:FadR/GntR family transcriptional regulator [soil metagenome]
MPQRPGGSNGRGLSKISTPKLVDAVAQEVSDWIVSRELKPGEGLPSEQELVASFGVARSVVREALVRLEALGIIEIHQGKGAFVSALPLALLLTQIRRLGQRPEAFLPDIWELREIVESAIEELAARRRSESDLENLEAAAQGMDEAIAGGELGDKEDALFHTCLTHAAHNAALGQVMTGVATLMDASRRRSLERPGRPETSNAEHRLVLEAVRRRDPTAAKEAMRVHLENGRALTALELEEAL